MAISNDASLSSFKSHKYVRSIKNHLLDQSLFLHSVVSSTLSILFRGGSLDEFAVTLDHFDSSLDLLQLVQAIGQREDDSSGPELETEIGDLLVILQSDEADLVKVDEHFNQVVAKVTELSQSSTDTQNTVVDVEGCNSSLTELDRLEKTEKLTT